jgi:flagellar assembly factor FliW
MMSTSLLKERAASVGGKASPKVSRKKTEQLEEVVIESRFGPVSIKPNNAINFPHGMPGVPGSNSFCLTDIPNAKTTQFQLLQSLNNNELSFIVVPSAYDNQLLEQTDLDDACSVLGITQDSLVLLFIVTSHDLPTGRRLSVNAKAPVFIDAHNKTAVQYIFQHNNYEIQHFIS